jgi:hypothetical protein
MPPLHAALARTAVADRDVELPHDRLAGQFDLVLLGDAGRHQASATVRAGLGQRCVEDFGDRFGSGHIAVRLGAVVRAGLAARWLGIGLRPARFAEGGCLTFAGAARLVERLPQDRVLRFEPLHAGLEFSQACQQPPTIRAGRFVHAVSIRNHLPRSCAPAREYFWVGERR